MICIFDVDGTLTDRATGKIVPSAKLALEKLRENNHLVCVASGRAYYKAKKFCDENGIDTFVANGGNSLCLRGKKIYNHPLPLDSCIALLEEVEKLGYGYLLVLNDSIDVFMKDDLFLKQMGERLEPTHYILDPSLDYHHVEAIYKIYISIPKECQNQLTTLNKLSYLRFAGDYLMIQPDAKRQGIYEMLDYIHESKDQVAVFGDDLNDLDMFNETWLKIAMGNGHPKLKEAADYVTDLNTEDGIYNACKYFHWI